MKKVLDPKKVEAGSKKSNEPRLLGSIVKEMLHGESPLAVGYRQYIASLENGEAEEQVWNPNTHLSVDLKTLLRSDSKMKAGKEYQGILRRDVDADEFRYDEHFTFVETVPQTAGKRNPHLFVGEYITITRKDDGSLRPNFKPMKVDRDFSVDKYAAGVANELLWALEGLVEKR